MGFPAVSILIKVTGLRGIGNAQHPPNSPAVFVEAIIVSLFAIRISEYERKSRLDKSGDGVSVNLRIDGLPIKK